MKRLILTNEEFEALSGLLDAAVRAVGLRAAAPASRIVGAMECAEEIEEQEDDGEAGDR